MKILVTIMILMSVFVFTRGLYTIPEKTILRENNLVPTQIIKESIIIPKIVDKITNTDIYIKRFKDVAISEMKKFGIPASITLAQGILESGSGTSNLAKIDNNHFGIKCKRKCIGCRCVNYADDSPYDMFRIFPTAWHSYREHSKLLATSARYANLFKLKITDYKGWAKGLQIAGYATSKTYSKSLIRIIEKYNLQKLDNL